MSEMAWSYRCRAEVARCWDPEIQELPALQMRRLVNRVVFFVLLEARGTATQSREEDREEAYDRGDDVE